MNVYDLETLPIRRIHTDDPARVREEMLKERAPLIVSGMERHYEFLKKWDLEFFESLDLTVPVQAPEKDGVNYFVKYTPLPISKFIARIRQKEGLYIGAREILGPLGVQSDKHGLGSLASQFVVPSFVDKERIWTANLWIGAGGNKTLLHYDAWDGLLFLGQGKKEFLIFPDSESPNMYQYGAFNFAALKEGKVLHSKISPMQVQQRYENRFSQAKGFRGGVKAGEFIYIPAGFWHFVESSEINIGVNFFLNVSDKRLYLREPLRTFWIKEHITLWPIRIYGRTKRFLGKVLRQLGLRRSPQS